MALLGSVPAQTQGLMWSYPYAKEVRAAALALIQYSSCILVLQDVEDWAMQHGQVVLGMQTKCFIL